MGIMNLAEIMDRSIEILKKYIATIIMFSIGYGVILFMVLFIFGFIGAFFVGFAAVVFKNIIFTIVMVSILCFIIIALTLTANVGIIKITSQELYEERIYASSAVGIAFKSIIKVFGISMIALLSFTPAIAILSVVWYFVYKSSESFRLINESPIVIVIYIIIFTILTLATIAVIIGYITIFAFSLQALTVEKKSVIDSVKRSFSLVRHDFWKIYGTVALVGATIYAIQYSIMSFLGLAISILFMILKIFNVQQSYTTSLTMALTYSNWPITIISWCIISPISTIMISLLYYNQRFKKEGYDMVLKLKEIQKKQEGEQLSEGIEFNKSL